MSSCRNEEEAGEGGTEGTTRSHHEERDVDEVARVKTGCDGKSIGGRRMDRGVDTVRRGSRS